MTPSPVTVELGHRGPFDDALVGFLGFRCVPGIEVVAGGTYRRSLRLGGGAGVAGLTPGVDHVACALLLEHEGDAPDAVRRCRALLDLDTDTAEVVAHLGHDPHLGPLVRQAPGRRIPGASDAFELAVRAVLGQQVSVAGAGTLAGRLVAARGTRLPWPAQGVTHVFPEPAALAEAGLAEVGMPEARKRALRALAAAVAGGDLVLDGGDPHDTAEALRSLPGIGPWTASYVAMRALGDRDAFLPADLGVRKAAAALGLPDSPRALADHALRWRPFRSYAVMHMWASL